MDARPGKVLLIGYGNPGRLDDGLGPALAARIERADLPGVTVDADYQLVVDDAAVVAEHDVVVFADASVDGPSPFFFERIRPEPATSFSSHSVAPPAVLALAESLFQRSVPGYLLGMRGYEFNEFAERLSPRARENLERAARFVRDLLTDRDFEGAAERHRRPTTEHSNTQN